MSHKIASEGSLTYGEELTKNTRYYLNLVKDMSWLNSRNHEHTDKDGNVVGYWVDLTIVLEAEAPWIVTAAPNTWKMRNSFRKFHFARDHMFREAGVTKSEMGKYGRTIRPFMDQNQVDYTDLDNPKEKNTLVPIGCTDGQREWTYTDLGASPSWETTETGSGGMSLVDKFKLTICDSNKVEATATGGTTTKYSTAGMIHSYNLDRMEVVTPVAEETISGPNNPLAQIATQSVTSGAIVDIAEEQELEAPPYDIRDAGDSIQTAYLDVLNTDAATLQVARVRNMFVPAGILAILHSSGSNVTPTIFVDVKGWSFCKDLA